MPFRPGVRWHSYYRHIAQDVMKSSAEVAAADREKRIKDTAAKEAAKAEKEREDGKKPKPPKDKDR